MKERLKSRKSQVRKPNKGVSSEEFCISCMDIPEEQRKGITLEIQQVAERLLKAHGVINEPGDLLKGEWFLKLQKPKFEKKTGSCKIRRGSLYRLL